MELARYFVVISLCIGLAQAGTVQFLDEDPDFSTHEVAKEFCEHNSGVKKQISYFGTVSRLVAYLDSLTPEHELCACAQEKLPLLKQLEQVLEVSQDSVCSDEKISAIEAFHKNHVASKVRVGIKAPAIVRVFFMRYASQIVETCAKQSFEHYSQLNGSKAVQSAGLGPEPKEMRLLDDVLSKVLQNFGISQPNMQQNQMFVIWNLIDSLPKKSVSRLSKYLSDGPTRVAMKLKGAGMMQTLRHVCIHTVKPSYSGSLLPVMRLVNLGYYPRDSRFIEQVNSEPMIKRLYGLMFLCETIIPVRVIEDSSMEEGGVAFLETEVAKLIPEEPVHPSIKLPHVKPNSPQPYSMVGLERLKPLDERVAMKVLKEIKHNMEERNGQIKKLLKRVFKSVKSNKSEKPKFLLVSANESENFVEKVEESLKSFETAEKSADELAMDAEEKDDLKTDEVAEPSAGSLLRKRRYIIMTDTYHCDNTAVQKNQKKNNIFKRVGNAIMNLGAFVVGVLATVGSIAALLIALVGYWMLVLGSIAMAAVLVILYPVFFVIETIARCFLPKSNDYY